MMLTFDFGARRASCDLSLGHRLAIDASDGEHPLFFVDQPITRQSLTAGGFVGDTRRGGSCNVEVLTMIPHCHGTHTEGPGHLWDDQPAAFQLMPASPLPAMLVSMAPRTGTDATETRLGEGPLIESDQIDWPDGCRALILRTLPNDPAKQAFDYASRPPYPLLSLEAMQRIANGSIEHLLIDTPSLDAADDGGRLALHRLFWGRASDASRPADDRLSCTVTELIYVPDAVADGPGLLMLGGLAIPGDATPSMPVFFPGQLEPAK